MNFQEAEKRYIHLRDQLSMRKITEEQFAEQVFNLRLQDDKGAWWQINGLDGSWLVWDGAAWQPAAPPVRATQPPKAKPQEQPRAADPAAKPKSEGGGIKGWFSQLGKGAKKAADNEAAPQATSFAAQMDAFTQQVRQIIEQRTKEGYVPTHPSVGINLWGSNLGAVIQAGVQGFTCSHCRHFSGWGIQWLWPVAAQVFGEQVTVTEITCYRNEWINHQATRLILPDGQHFVIDFWEGILAGEPRIYPEAEWIAHYTQRIGGNVQVLTMEGRA